MKKWFYCSLFAFMCFAFAKAQSPYQPTTNKKTDSLLFSKNDYWLEGDSIVPIELSDVYLRGNLKFTSRYEEIRYALLKRRVAKTWPYAVLAADRLNKIESRMKRIKDADRRDDFIKEVDEYVKNEFTAELKKMSRSEGQVLIKLIHRQTGDTSYDLVKKLKSGWKAFWLNATASTFDLSLKAEFEPHTNVEDFYIEDILLNHFKNETLEYQPSALEISYATSLANWTKFEKNLPEDYDKKNLAEREKNIKEYLAKKKRKDDKKKRKEERQKKRN